MIHYADRDWVVEMAREFSSNGWKVVEIRTPEVAITLSDGSVPAAPGPAAIVPLSAPEPAATVTSELPPAKSAVNTAPAHVEVETQSIDAPGVGVFWDRPKPEAPAFAEVGARVEVGDTVGLLEVMKMFTEVKADRAGRVTEVLSNGSFVEFGEALVKLSVEAG